ncbi:aldehyde dehydrogenase domain-containing protein [Xylariaceae sp. FL0804]|nr:aldehyde dehydrogenase domain-containing protein [Xylariaceae sp. FL0804]
MAQELPFQLKCPSLLRSQSLVGGEWVEAKSGKRFGVIDPGTGREWASVPDNDASDVESAVSATHQAFVTYSKISPRTRSRCLARWSLLIEEHKEDLAKIVTFETGKTLSDSLSELDYCINAAHWFAGEADRIQGTAFDSALPGKKGLTIKQPIGVVAALVPWNFPVAMIIRKAGAALAAGCTMVIKPSPETPLSVLALAVLAEKAGLPKGVLSILPTSMANTPGLSEALCRHPLIKKVTFTGSIRVGRIIATICAEGLKKVTLELGGNCPFIVFDDADLDQAADALMGLKWRNAGQVCISANRVFVQSGVYERFCSIMRERTAKLVVGQGDSATATMGAITTPHSLDRASAQVNDARSHGAKVLCGGEKATTVSSSAGFFFEPTVIADVTKAMRVSHEEIFAPILAMYKFETEAEAVETANDTPMGLASYVFTKNLDRGWRLMENLEAGMIGVNTSAITGAELPFGGMKESGYGKEAGKDVAVDEYLVTKAVSVTVDSRVSCNL